MIKLHEIWCQPVTARNILDIIHVKFKRCKKYFKGWGANMSGHLRKRRKILKEELDNLEALEEEGALLLEHYFRKVEIMTLLHQLYAEEEIYWFQRSHQKWLLEGDCNTKYFHRVANGRKRKNTIFSLESESGTITDPALLLQHATEFYKTLFGPALNLVIHVDPSLWDEVENVTPEDNDLLSQPFSKDEIHNALVSIDKNKAPGPDGLPIEFFSCGMGLYET